MKRISKVFITVIASVLAAVMCVMCVSAESIFDSSKEIKAGKKYSGEINDKSKKCNYKIKVESKGTMTVSITSDIEYLDFYIYDSNGSELTLDKSDILSGKASSSSDNTFYTDKQNGTFKANIRAEVKKGTYYIQFVRTPYLFSDGKFSFSVSIPGADSSSVNLSTSKNNTVRIYLEKGDKITLAAVTGDKSVSSASWKSSDEKVAKVSSNGKITAVKTGKCTVTWTNGSSKFTIYVEVE